MISEVQDSAPKKEPTATELLIRHWRAMDFGVFLSEEALIDLVSAIEHFHWTPIERGVRFIRQDGVVMNVQFGDPK